MIRRLLTATILLTGAFLFTSCGSGSDPHCRIYLVSDNTGTIDSLKVVDSPASGNWGPNLLNEPAEYLEEHPTWRVFRFAAGRTVDHQLIYTIGARTETYEEQNGTCRDGQGMKYDLNGGGMYCTTFNFDH